MIYDISISNIYIYYYAMHLNIIPNWYWYWYKYYQIRSWSVKAAEQMRVRAGLLVAWWWPRPCVMCLARVRERAGVACELREACRASKQRANANAKQHPPGWQGRTAGRHRSAYTEQRRTVNPTLPAGSKQAKKFS